MMMAAGAGGGKAETRDGAAAWSVATGILFRRCGYHERGGYMRVDEVGMRMCNVGFTDGASTEGANEAPKELSLRKSTATWADDRSELARSG